MSICFSETTYTSPSLSCCLSSAILLIKGKSKGLFWSFLYFVVALWAGRSSTAGSTRPDVPYLCCKGIWPGFTCQWSIVVSAEQVSPLQWNHQRTQMEARITFLVSRDKLSEEQSRFKELLPCHYVAFGGSRSPVQIHPPPCLVLAQCRVGTTKRSSGKYLRRYEKVDLEQPIIIYFIGCQRQTVKKVSLTHTHTHGGNGNDMCNCQMSFLLCLWVRRWFPAYARSLIAWPAETLFICVKSKWSCQCWVTRRPSCKLLILIFLYTWFISMFIIVLALAFGSAFGVFFVYSSRGKLSLAVISVWSAEGEAQNFAPDSDFGANGTHGWQKTTERHKKFDKQNTVKQKQKEPVGHLSASFLSAGWHTCFQSTIFFTQNQMKTLSQLVKRIQTSYYLVYPIYRKSTSVCETWKISSSAIELHCILIDGVSDLLTTTVCVCDWCCWMISAGLSLWECIIGAFPDRCMEGGQMVVRKGFLIPGMVEHIPVGRGKAGALMRATMQSI